MKLKTLFESLDSEIRELERVLNQSPDDLDVKAKLQHLKNRARVGAAIVLGPKGGLRVSPSHHEMEIGSLVLKSGLSQADAEDYVKSIENPKNPRCPECNTFMSPMVPWTPKCEFCSNYKESMAQQIAFQRELGH